MQTYYVFQKSLKCKHFSHQFLNFPRHIFRRDTNYPIPRRSTTQYWESSGNFLKKTVHAINDNKVNTAFMFNGS